MRGTATSGGSGGWNGLKGGASASSAYLDGVFETVPMEWPRIDGSFDQGLRRE